MHSPDETPNEMYDSAADLLRIDNCTVTAASWIPLERALGSAGCDDFMWMGAAGSIQFYKNRDTRRYLLIDAQTGFFHDDQDGRQLSREYALNYVFS